MQFFETNVNYTKVVFLFYPPHLYTSVYIHRRMEYSALTYLVLI